MSNNSLIPKMSEMTMVDYFASQALNSLIKIRNYRILSEEDCKEISLEAYTLAAFMFEEKYKFEEVYEEQTK